MQPNSQALYCILKSPYTHEEPGRQLALHVQIWKNETNNEHPEILCFYDTGRGHMIYGKCLDFCDDSFTFLDRNDCIWELREVTIQEFRRRLASFVVNGRSIADELETTEALWAYYREKFPI